MPDDPAAPSPMPGTPPPEPVGASGLPSNVAAALAVMIPLIGGIAFLFLERKDRFVRFYSVQSIVLGVFLAAAYMMESLLVMMFHPIPLIGDFVGKVTGFIYGIFALVWMVVYFVAMMKSFSGKVWAIPYLGPVVKKYLAP